MVKTTLLRKRLTDWQQPSSVLPLFTVFYQRLPSVGSYPLGDGCWPASLGRLPLFPYPPPLHPIFTKASPPHTERRRQVSRQHSITYWERRAVDRTGVKTALWWSKEYRWDPAYRGLRQKEGESKRNQWGEKSEIGLKWIILKPQIYVQWGEVKHAM